MARRKRKVSHETPQLREWGGTPETVRKLSAGTIEILLRKGRIDPVHISAADEIRRVFNGTTAPVQSRNMMLDRVDGGNGKGDVSESLALLYKTNFIPWANDLTAREHQGGPPIFSVVLDIVTQDTQASDIDHMRRWRKGKAANYLVEGLELYAIQAGWIRRR